MYIPKFREKVSINYACQATLENKHVDAIFKQEYNRIIIIFLEMKLMLKVCLGFLYKIDSLFYIPNIISLCFQITLFIY